MFIFTCIESRLVKQLSSDLSYSVSLTCNLSNILIWKPDHLICTVWEKILLDSRLHNRYSKTPLLSNSKNTYIVFNHLFIMDIKHVKM